MKNIFISGAKVFGKIVFANVLSIITIVSISFLVNVMFTDSIGYYAVGSKEGSEQPEILYEYYYKDGEDTKLAEYEEQGYVIEQRGIRSQVDAKGNAAFIIIGALFTLSLGATITYSYLWKEGNKDLNLIRFGRAELDKYKGAKIGFVAMVPYTVMLLVLAIGKASYSSNFPVVFFKYLNASAYTVLEVICGKASTFGDLAVWRIILLFALMLIVPIYMGISYYIGYRDILVTEKFIYKKQK